MKPEPKTPEECLTRAFELEKTGLEIKPHDPLGYRGVMMMAHSYLERGVEIETASKTGFYNNLQGSEGAV